MKFKLPPGIGVPDTLKINDFTTTREEIRIRSIPHTRIPVIDNIIGMPMLFLREYPETVVYTTHWRVVEINTLEELLEVQKYLGNLIITKERVDETDTDYSIEIVHNCEDD